jgi:hypothetical protein
VSKKSQEVIEILPVIILDRRKEEKEWRGRGGEGERGRRRRNTIKKDRP